MVRRLAEPVWLGIATLRDSLHGGFGCPTRLAPYTTARRWPTRCDDCVGEHDLILTEVIRRYRDQSPPPANPEGWARRVAERLAVDRDRARRVAQGALARVTIRGTVARLIKRCPTPWHARLLTLILTHAGHGGPLPRERWPLDHWLAERARFLGQPLDPGALPALRREIEEVMAIARRHGGMATMDGRPVSWAERYIDCPLDRRPPADVISIEGYRERFGRTLPLPEPPVDPAATQARRVCARIHADLRANVPVRAAVLRRVAETFGAAATRRLVADRDAYREFIAVLVAEAREPLKAAAPESPEAGGSVRQTPSQGRRETA